MSPQTAIHWDSSGECLQLLHRDSMSVWLAARVLCQRVVGPSDCHGLMHEVNTIHPRH